MINYTQNNHLRYTIGDREFGYRETPYEKYTVSVGKIDHEHYKRSSWIQEQYRTADMIHHDFGNDLVVMYSGGTDSEIVLRMFKRIGVKPRVVMIKFKNDYNIHDYIVAKRVCDELDLALETIDFDVYDFYHSGQASEFAQEIQCRQIAYLIVYHNCVKLNQPCIMGGEMLFRKHVTATDSRWYYCWRESEDASSLRTSMKYEVPIINEWFSYTPEMMAYYLTNTKIQKLLTEKNNYKLASVSSKNAILKEYISELVDKNKTHGYEKLLGLNMEAYNTLYCAKRLEPSIDGIFIDEFRKQLFGE